MHLRSTRTPPASRLPATAGRRPATQALPAVAAALAALTAVLLSGGGAPAHGAPMNPAATPPQNGQSCAATLKATSAWSGGYQAEVTVRNTGSVPLPGWTVMWPQPSGQTIVSMWNAVQGTVNTLTTAQNAAYNGQLVVSGSTTFGYVVNGGGSPPSGPALGCLPG
ncbi:cellulose binding domain-containing protein [Streptomyces sp. NBC_01477]|uniref:cellulose binding domain-containing protein n=1 Tax=Streptomyces sp. NBC_01477 TaxID=2976015 RepID=UPI002E311D26|nr:cellulose binding domain-containing protein [Streptomyces sp. NBC_01477]